MCVRLLSNCDGKKLGLSLQKVTAILSVGIYYHFLSSEGEAPLSLDSVRVQALLVSVLGVLAGLVFVALSLLVALVLLKRYSKKVAATQGGVEMSLRRSLR